MKDKNIIKILILFSILMLLIAFGNNPYGYYQFLRWLVSGTAAYSVYLLFQIIELNNESKTFKKNRYYLLILIYSLVAVVYNPISPFYLNRDSWETINLLTIFIFIVGFINFKKLKLYGKSK